MMRLRVLMMEEELRLIRGNVEMSWIKMKNANIEYKNLDQLGYHSLNIKLGYDVIWIIQIKLAALNVILASQQSLQLLKTMLKVKNIKKLRLPLLFVHKTL